MADRMGAEISIGGRIQRASLELFAEALSSESFDDTNVDDEVGSLAALADLGEHFGGHAYEVAWGEFPELEAKCRELGLTYVRTSEPKYEYNGEYVYFSPETGILQWQRNSSGHIVFTADELEELFPVNATDEELRAAHAKLLVMIAVPECPPLEIVE